MKIKLAPHHSRALTFVEVIVGVVVLLGLLVLILPYFAQCHSRATRIVCVCNLKEVGLGFRTWAGDHGELYPMKFYTNRAGGPRWLASGDLFRYFQVLSNSVKSLTNLVCPDDKQVRSATNFAGDFGPQTISYFAALQADESDPNMFLAGDRNITNGLPILGGLLRLDTNRVAGWIHKIHHGAGNIAITDGSVQQLKSSGLNTAVLHSGVTNWLLFP